MTYRTAFIVCALAIATAMCGENSTPTQPTTPTTPTPTPTPNVAPLLDSPAADAQLDNLRPTLTVKNGTSSQTGAKTYEFQVSDRSDFGANSGGASAYYAVSATKTGIAEGSPTTNVAIDTDLQPATRFYWRSRWVQGSTNGDWSETFTFRTQIVGYNRTNELYDPLVNGATVAELRFKRTTFIAGKGLRVDDSDSYVRYRLGQTITNGEFSLDIEGISNSPVSENSDT
ncbi:MAG: fibronectin type III domain-containing protein, partial [Vicinamibacterales bacterium]|nr:fibronectin type III domain-containing protein [Vicinamibacterales bacterium]